MTGNHIDKAYAALLAMRSEFHARSPDVQTEADTRALIIDRVLADVLGWRPAQIERETFEDGDRLDYRLSASAEHAIVEAKRSSIDFGIPATDARWYKRSGPVARSEPLKSTIEQAEAYAARWGCGLVCATTGLQWVFLLGSRTDGVSKESSSILVFRSLDEICEATLFKLFFEVGAEPNVRSGLFRRPFLREEGVIAEPTQGTSKRLIDVRGQDRQRKRSEVAKALAPVLKDVFEGLSSSHNPEALRACFVETHESIEADSRLQRIAAELTEDIEPLDTRAAGQGDRLGEIVAAEATDVSFGEDRPGTTVLLLGQHGSGKSTFVDSFFAQKLPVELKKKCLVVHIDLSKADPDPKALPSYLKSQTLLAIQQRLFKGGSPGYDELKGIFFDEYQALARGPLKPLKESRPEEFNIEFGRRLEKSVQDQEGYLRRLLRHIRWSRKKLLCVIFDNADHFNDEFQSVAFLQAQWTAGLGRMLLLLPMRDTTYWRARQQSAFHAIRNTILYLPRPALAKVLEKRFEFAIGELSKGDKTSIRSLRGFRIGIKNPAELLHTLHKTFTKDLYISRSMAMLATGDIREALRLFEACVSSPQLDLDKLLAAYLSDGNYRLGRTAYERAVFLGDWEQFSQDRSRRVCNLFCCPREAAISPLLGFRVLMRCYELRNQETTKADKGFESVEGLLSFFSTLGVPRSSTDKALGALLYSGLLEPYDLGSLGPDFDGSGTGTVKFVKLSSSGRLHRQWVENSVQYGLAMCDDVQIFDEDELTALRERSDRRNLALRRRDFAAAQAVESEMMSQVKEYVLRRDSELISIPDSDIPAMKTQKMVDSRLVSWVQAGRGKQFDEPLE